MREWNRKHPYEVMPGDLVQIFVDSGKLDELGVGVYLREVVPKIDLPYDHEFWEWHMEIGYLSEEPHYEVLYDGQVRVLNKKQFKLWPVER
jgi:hypothetical protein